ncbi:DciA family protein [Anthocerotibacter panamensis]|uniref:DciA family protein n=1 Tax=Anthocerotibacter panamensis TaxID=2857077 RepID=UPI001C40364B|nr:DUF721 domain-containing protein [Anthocerotibacter panamensis]
MARPESVNNVLQKLQQTQDWRKTQQFLAILEIWSQVAGPLVTPHARPQRLSDGQLWVATSSPVWAQQLTLQRQALKDRLLAHLPDLRLKDIRFAPTGWHTPPPTPITASVAAKVEAMPFHWPATDDPQERLAQVIQVVHWRQAQWPSCPGCTLKAHPASFKRWKCCPACHLAEAGVTKTPLAP